MRDDLLTMETITITNVRELFRLKLRFTLTFKFLNTQSTILKFEMKF